MHRMHGNSHGFRFSYSFGRTDTIATINDSYAFIAPLLFRLFTLFPSLNLFILYARRQLILKNNNNKQTHKSFARYTSIETDCRIETIFNSIRFIMQ